MRSKAVAVLVAVLLIVLALTNPGRDDFVHWFERKAEAAARGHDVLSGLSLLERTLEVKTSLRRDNYLLFSVFHVRVMRRDHVFVGILGVFLGVGDAGQAVPGASSATASVARRGPERRTAGPLAARGTPAPAPPAPA